MFDTPELHETREALQLKKILSLVFQDDDGKWCNYYLKYFFKNKFHFNFKKFHLLIRNETR